MNREDQELLEAARVAIKRAHRGGMSTVAAALRAGSGRIYVGANLESCFGPCAEPVALGAAFAAGETEIVAIVAVGHDDSVFPPCGNCRQILLEHAAATWVLTGGAFRLERTRTTDLLPSPYLHRPRDP